MTTGCLVRHPAPQPTESLLGYVLRLSEKNGYISPLGVCRLAGIKQNGLSAIGLKVDKLAAIANCGMAELGQIAFAHSVNGHRISQLLGHQLAPREINRTHPKICPECVTERGCIEAHWHLELMVGCPIHRCVATSQCPQCGEGLRWLRPGLLECDCGGNLGDSDMPPISIAEAELLNALRRKLLRYPAGDDDCSSLPEEQLMTMNLRSMLAVVRALAKHRLIADNCTADPGNRQVILAASKVLTDWPNNFFVLLKDIGEQGSVGEYGGVGKQYGDIYQALFRNSAVSPSDYADFLRDAFLEFAMGGHVHPFADDNSIASLDTELQPVATDAEYGAQAEMLLKTAKRLLKTLRRFSTSTPKYSTTGHLSSEMLTDGCRRRREPGMILDIVRQGSALGRVKLVDLQIADGAGPAFYRAYIPLAAIAATEQATIVELMRRCSEGNVRVLLLRVSKQGLQPIIRATDRGRLTSSVREDEGLAIAPAT